MVGLTGTGHYFVILFFHSITSGHRMDHRDAQGTPLLHQGSTLPQSPKQAHLERELGGTHYFYDVKGSPADVISQHLQLLGGRNSDSQA